MIFSDNPVIRGDELNRLKWVKSVKWAGSWLGEGSRGSLTMGNSVSCPKRMADIAVPSYFRPARSSTFEPLREGQLAMSIGDARLDG